MTSPSYQKKLFGEDTPLSETFTAEQIKRRIAMYQELNDKRVALTESEQATKKFALYGKDDTTTVRVYMRETVSKIAAELFKSSYTLSVKNKNTDKDHGYVVVTVTATLAEINALLEYIKPGSSYYVYDGEQSKYIAGDTSKSEFIIVKTTDMQPKHFWRRSQSFIAKIEELE